MNRQQRRVIALTAAGILLAALLGGSGWWLGQRGGQQPAASGVTGAPATTPPPAATSPPAATTPAPTTRAQAGTWARLPAAPLATGLYQSSGVWTGRELLLYGAVLEREGGLRAAGAAYNPASGTWRALPAAPGPAQSIEGGYKAVWTGRELLGWGLGLDAAYNPASNTWRRLAAIPLGGPSIMAWTGRQVLIWGGGCCDDNSADGYAYTPASDTWRRLPPAPLAGRHTGGAWTGSELIVAGGTGADNRGGVAGYRTFTDAAAYDPATRSWRRLPPMPEPRAGASVTWTGSEVVVVGGQDAYGTPSRLYADGVAYSPASNRWRRLPAMEAGRTGHSAVWTGSQLLVWGGRTLRAGSWATPPHGLAYDPAGNRWSALPASPLRGRSGHVAAWTGSRMLVWGGSAANQSGPDTYFTDGAAYTPYQL